MRVRVLRPFKFSSDGMTIEQADPDIAKEIEVPEALVDGLVAEGAVEHTTVTAAYEKSTPLPIEGDIAPTKVEIFNNKPAEEAVDRGRPTGRRHGK